MADRDCTRFLQHWLPRLGLQWHGYRKVRRIVCKRVRRRMRALSLAGYDEYARYLTDIPQERQFLAELCRIPISRFCRDKAVFDALAQRLLPALAEEERAQGGTRLSVWSAGCASGEEAYTVSILWALQLAPRFPDIALYLLATDVEPQMIERARRGCYGKGSLRDVPEGWIRRAFDQDGDQYCVRGAYRDAVHFDIADLLSEPPEGRFDVILCRNLAFTYFSHDRQVEALAILSARLRPGGFLIIGAHEKLPGRPDDFRPLGCLPVYEKMILPLSEPQDPDLQKTTAARSNGTGTAI